NLADPVFTIVLDASAANGAYTFTLLRPLDHPIAGTQDDIVLDIRFTARDGDGDAIGGGFTVTVRDDAPAASGAANAAVDEGGLVGSAGEILITGAQSLGIAWGADADTRGAGDAIGRALSFNLVG